MIYLIDEPRAHKEEGEEVRERGERRQPMGCILSSESPMYAQQELNITRDFWKTAQGMHCRAVLPTRRGSWKTYQPLLLVLPGLLTPWYLWPVVSSSIVGSDS